MLGFKKAAPTDGADLNMKSAAGLMPQQWTARLDDHCLDLRWSPDGAMLAAMPSLGEIVIFSPTVETIAKLPGHAEGNGSIAWHPAENRLLTYGQDAEIRIHEAPFTAAPRIKALEKAWAERAEWSADGTHLAAALGKTVVVLDAEKLGVVRRIPGQRSTICDLSWNPREPKEFATVCDGGVRLWKLGRDEPTGHFDWGGASLISTWSPNGRWVVTGDQTPSVHLYDVRSKDPLHIQGYESKVKALAWQDKSEWLATGGGRMITIWPCTGKRGPRGSTPIQLTGHTGDAVAMDFGPGGELLASGGRDGLVLLWMPHKSEKPALISLQHREITRVRWAPAEGHLAVGTEGGDVFIFSLQS